MKPTMSSGPTHCSEPRGKSSKKKIYHAESQSRGAALYRSKQDGEHLRPKHEGLKLLATNPSRLWQEALGVAREIQAPNDTTPTAHSGCSRSTHAYRTPRGTSIYDGAQYLVDSHRHMRSQVYHDSPPSYDTLYPPGLGIQHYEMQEVPVYKEKSPVSKNAGIYKSEEQSHGYFVCDGISTISQQEFICKTQNTSQVPSAYNDTSYLFSGAVTRSSRHASQEPAELDDTSSSFR
jgi:hypothetical protein